VVFLLVDTKLIHIIHGLGLTIHTKLGTSSRVWKDDIPQKWIPTYTPIKSNWQRINNSTFL